MPDAANKRIDVHGSLVLLPVALVVALISGFWAWRLASGEFAPVPVISSPGVIMLATYGRVVNHDPIKVSIEYDGEVNQSSITYYDLSFSQEGSAAAARSKIPETIAVFLCGPAARNPDFWIQTTGLNKPVAWQSADKFNVLGLQGDSYVFPDQCVVTLVPLVYNPSERYISTPTMGTSNADLTGYAGPPPSKVSGAGIAYAWPGILTLPQAESPSDALPIAPLMKGSTYTVLFLNMPDDISNVVSDPSLTLGPDDLQVTGSFDNDSILQEPEEFRLSGDLSNSQASDQRDLFIAGALVGVAGGAAIWFLELLAKLLLNPRSSSGAEADSPGEGKDSGLGWPG